MKPGVTRRMRPEDPPPAPIALGRIVRAAADMLEREMSQVVDEWLDVDVNCPGKSQYAAARQALTIMLLCRNLADEIRHYENDNQWIEGEGKALNF